MRLLVTLVLVSVSYAQIINKKVDRVIDLSSQIVKVTSLVEVENSGSNSASVYEVAIDPISKDHLSYIAVTEGDHDLSLSKITDSVFEVSLNSALAPKATTTLTITTTFTHVLEPFPRAINQPDNQLVRHNGNAYYYSLYDTVQQSAKFNLGSSKIESFTPRTPSAKEGQSVKYGPYSDISAKSSARITLHFENNSPFLTIKDLTRIVEVSHWGNIAVEEHYHMAHEGATLKSQFSRLDFQRNPIGAPTAIKSFRTVLPASSKDVYYRDDIGNISTSNLRETDDANELEIRPRFPLFGGWKTKYYIGYNVPSYEMLSHAGDSYKLEFPFVDHTYDNLVVDEAEVRVILPEGSSDFEVVYPDYDIERLPDEKFKTYLDTFGRPVLVFKARNLEENHIKNVEVYYNFNSILLLQEPLLVVMAFMVLFISVIVLVRLDFSISVDENREARQRVSFLVEEVMTLTTRIKNEVCDETVALLAAAKVKKDSKQLKTSRRDLELLYKQITDSIAAVSKMVLASAPNLADKIAEVSRREGERKSVLASIHTLAEQVVGDKVSKNVSANHESSLTAKLHAVQTNVEDALAAL